MRERIWSFVRSFVPEGMILPWWALTVSAILYPINFAYWKLSKSRGYNPEYDYWLIEGVKYSSRSLKMLSKSGGRAFKVTRSNDIIIFQEINNDESQAIR